MKCTGIFLAGLAAIMLLGVRKSKAVTEDISPELIEAVVACEDHKILS